ncbi:MAG: SDR family oxidoreductase [Deltaproteobacteria bacterium]|nr:SDR family oxidoreductase [Deltaproteobacteria bacterium]
MRYANRVFFVTGGSRGIGRSIVERLVAEGARVCVVDVDRQGGADVVRELGERVLFVGGEISREPAVRNAIKSCVRWGGRLDGVINNAAIADPDSGPIEKLSLAAWQKFVDVNLTGTFLVTKYAVPHLRKTRGSIVNLGSTRAVQSEPHTEAYATCKGGVVALTHALAISLGPDVRVNCISPGWIDTRGQKLRKQEHAQHPVGRVGRPEDVAGLCAWLLSEEAAFMTGQNLVIDGGMTRKMIYA